MIGLFGPGDGQTGGFWLRDGVLCHISIYPLMSVSYCGFPAQRPVGFVGVRSFQAGQELPDKPDNS
jgi:hypothetical protein